MTDILSSNDSQHAFALIKFFSKEEHFQWFKKDEYSMFRTPHYYRMCEDAGRGDRNESCIGYWNKSLGDEIPEFIMNRGRVKSIESLLIYPSHEPRDSWMQSWCVIGKFNEFELSLSKMIEEFGCHFAILPARKIGDYAALISRASGLDVNYGYVKYSDNPLDSSLSTKNKEFQYQKEFRFYIGQCDKSETKDKELHVKGVSGLLEEAGSLKFTSPTGDVRYCSLGSKEVVLA